jgi:hypothetical protein
LLGLYVYWYGIVGKEKGDQENSANTQCQSFNIEYSVHMLSKIIQL